MKVLTEFESVKHWRESLEQSSLSRGKPLTRKAWYHRVMTISEYSPLMGLSPDELLAEGADAAMKRLTDYFLWLTREEVEGLALRVRAVSWNSACTLQAVVRGFYTHNDVVFPKRFKTPRRKRSEVSKRDSRAPVFEYDEESELTQMNGLLSHFVSNLNFRDQTIAVCLLATGIDAADLLNLKISFLKDGRGQMTAAPRIPWHGNRLKDGVEFRTYFSREATACLRRYVEQERTGAVDDEPIFVKEDGKPLNAHTLSENFRGAAERMGYAREGQSSAFRLKRFRHLFREACSAARVDQGYVEAFMGHSSTVSSSYLEKGEGSFLREYIKVEPYVTLFGVDKNCVTDLAETLEGQRIKVEELEGKLTETGDRFAETYDRNQALEVHLRDLDRKVRDSEDDRSKLQGEVTNLREDAERSKARWENSVRNLETFEMIINRYAQKVDALEEAIREYGNEELVKALKERGLVPKTT